MRKFLYYFRNVIIFIFILFWIGFFISPGIRNNSHNELIAYIAADLTAKYSMVALTTKDTYFDFIWKLWQSNYEFWCVDSYRCKIVNEEENDK